MCEVCAIFGAGEHWSDFARQRDERFPFEDILHYREERRRRVAMLNALVQPLGLICEDWDGEALALTDARGRTKIAPTLGDVWPVAESLSGRSIDPLTEDFIAPVAIAETPAHG
ncbi:hypothetical protein [Xanthobacter sp. YC-JY1]|uniref:hypothetical protein n=1 Tax=Xanthobacter sp. YC-JY1 TaxID=2419844 RepID=UPI001F2298FC|nr:hypothetical protein [Xanthobacter sp. YC-JY1]UJX44105.1 hypothetical protein D7006_04710 [Xanthobacter sp. YC-JY1]